MQFGGSFSQSGGILRIMGVVHISESVGLCKLVGYVQNHGVVKIRRYGQNHGVVVTVRVSCRPLNPNNNIGTGARELPLRPDPRARASLIV